MSPGELPESSDRQVSVGAAGGRAGARVVDVGDQRVGRGADHRLQVDAGVRQRRDGQRPLPAQPGRQSGAGEPRHRGRTGELSAGRHNNCSGISLFNHLEADWFSEG